MYTKKTPSVSEPNALKENRYSNGNRSYQAFSAEFNFTRLLARHISDNKIYDGSKNERI